MDEKLQEIPNLPIALAPCAGRVCFNEKLLSLPMFVRDFNSWFQVIVANRENTGNILSDCPESCIRSSLSSKSANSAKPYHKITVKLRFSL